MSVLTFPPRVHTQSHLPKARLNIVAAVAVQVPEVKVHAEALLPSSSVIGFTLGQGLSFITFVNTVPISATRSINRFALIRRLDVDRVGKFVFNMPAWDSLARDAMIKYVLFSSPIMIR